MGEQLMTCRCRHIKRRILFSGAILSISLIAGCTGDSGDAHGATGEPSRSHSAASTINEKQLGERAEEALGTQTIDDSDPRFVESGLERASDGIHAESAMTRGNSYELDVVCAGSGKVALSVTLKPPLHREVACDGVPLHQRITHAPGRIRIDTENTAGAVGMIAYRVTRIEK
ncbi:hypothetical protein ACWGQ5_45550 [Streptomyces sp. NPDC055722]